MFVGTCLTAGGIWSHPRTSDGIPTIVRNVARGPDALGICAYIHEIADQSLHAFWLELRGKGERVAWALYFDVIETSPRRARNALDNHAHPDAIEWRVTLTGEATVEDGVLTPVPRA